MSQMKNKMDAASARIGVVGAGSWGTALASLLGMKGYPVKLWAYEPEVRDDIARFHENKWFLPEIPLSENIDPTNDLAEVVSEKDLVVVVVPSPCHAGDGGKVCAVSFGRHCSGVGLQGH
ncbi:MAG: NAD(P)-binding domain-containing protein [Desulfobacterales bacterium]